MSRLLQFFRNLFPRSTQPSIPPSHYAHDFSRFAPYDRVLLRHGKRAALSTPLQANGVAKLSWWKGNISHNDIIGERITTLVLKNTRNEKIRITHPTLEEYVSLAPRLVTPIYSSYASTIVNLLDIHVSPPPQQAEPNGEGSTDHVHILEAGTGHGSLTLHLARAIAGVNAPFPPQPLPDLSLLSDNLSDVKPQAEEQTASQQAWVDWRRGRHAIIHSVERDAKTQRHAEKLIRSFRGGLYWPHINFYTGYVHRWVSNQLETRRSNNIRVEFVTHAVLDLPDVNHCILDVADVLAESGTLIVFAPSISQLGETLKHIQQNDIRLTLDQVVELGEGISTGRKWDLRLVKPRKQLPQHAELVQQTSERERPDPEEAIDEEQTENNQKPGFENGNQVLVCRPKVGERVVGGGFVGIWKKRLSRLHESDLNDDNTADGESGAFQLASDGPVTTLREGISQTPMNRTNLYPAHKDIVHRLLVVADEIVDTNLYKSQRTPLSRSADTLFGMFNDTFSTEELYSKFDEDLASFRLSFLQLYKKLHTISKELRVVYDNVRKDFRLIVFTIVIRRLRDAPQLSEDPDLKSKPPISLPYRREFASRLQRALLGKYQFDIQFLERQRPMFSRASTSGIFSGPLRKERLFGHEDDLKAWLSQHSDPIDTDSATLKPGSEFKNNVMPEIDQDELVAAHPWKWTDVPDSAAILDLSKPTEIAEGTSLMSSQATAPLAAGVSTHALETGNEAGSITSNPDTASDSTPFAPVEPPSEDRAISSQRKRQRSRIHRISSNSVDVRAPGSRSLGSFGFNSSDRRRIRRRAVQEGYAAGKANAKPESEASHDDPNADDSNSSRSILADDPYADVPVSEHGTRSR